MIVVRSQIIQLMCSLMQSSRWRVLRYNGSTTCFFTAKQAAMRGVGSSEQTASDDIDVSNGKDWVTVIC